MQENPVEKESSSTPAFDRTMLMDLTGQDLELLQAVLDVFLDEAPKQIKSLKASIEAGDEGLVAKEGHSMKGAASAAAAVTIRDLALEIEIAGKTGEMTEARALFERLESEFQRFKREAVQ